MESFEALEAETKIRNLETHKEQKHVVMGKENIIRGNQGFGSSRAQAEARARDGPRAETSQLNGAAGFARVNAAGARAFLPGRDFIKEWSSTLLGNRFKVSLCLKKL